MANQCIAGGDGRGTQLSDLPGDLISSIAARIHRFVDYVRFESVIRPIVPVYRSSRHLRMLHNFPWVVIDIDETTKILCFFTGQLFFPVKNAVRAAEVLALGSSFGWLVMTDTRSSDDPHTTNQKGYLRIYLLNPCTNQRIQFPLFEGPQNRYGKFMLLLDSFLSPGTKDADDVVLVMIDYYGFVGFCGWGDKEWSFGDRRVANFLDDILFFKGVLYGVSDMGDIVTFDFVNVETGRMLCERPFPLERPDRFNVSGYCQYNNFFLVESGGELMLVVKDVDVCCRSNDAEDHGQFCKCYDMAAHFRVFTLDFCGRRWVQLTSLGDRMLLIDQSCSMSLDAAKFSKFGFKPNCIYYTNYGLYTDDYGWHEFCMEDDKIVPYSCNFSTLLPILMPQ